MITLPAPNSKADLVSTTLIGSAGLTVTTWSSIVAEQVEIYLSLGVQAASLLYISTMIILNYPKAKKVIIRAFSKDEGDSK